MIKDWPCYPYTHLLSQSALTASSLSLYNMNLTTNTHAASSYTNGCRTFWAAAHCQLRLLVRFISHQQTQLRASTESFPIFVSFVQLTWKPILLKLLMLWQRGFVIHSFIPPFHPGYCSDLFAGHLSTPPPKGIIGYNGEAGYRRNTFDLRRRPSVFGDTEEGAYSWVHVTDPVMWPLCVEKLYLYITV